MSEAAAPAALGEGISLREALERWPTVLEGRISVEAALQARIREVHGVWATRPGDPRLRRLRALAREADVAIVRTDAAEIDEAASGRTHGGVMALVGPRRDISMRELLEAAGESPLLVMLDGVEDPFNHGQAVRALYAAGVDGLIVQRNWETAVTTVTRASAGATELLPTATVAGVRDAAAACRAAGLRVVCAVADDDAPDLYHSNLTGGTMVLIGGERRGVTRSFVDEADERVRIAYGRDRAPELGAATSAAVIAFEALRQRRAEPV